MRALIQDPETDDEDGRLRALERYDILDNAEEKPIENIVNLVQQTLHVPMCAISLVHRKNQWFKGARGVGLIETSRDFSFGSHIVQRSDNLVVCNALEDPLFATNPLVTGEPYIRACAGVPLKTPDGYRIGSLCALDIQPREFPEFEIAILESLAKVVVDELELKQIASRDHLTGAETRRAWMAKAHAEIARASRYRRPISVMILDLDNFKAVNDSHGHPSGDVVIKTLADLCMKTLRQSDFFGRLGGEEFALMMPETSAANACVVAERIRAGFEASAIDIGDIDPLFCTVSVGVASDHHCRNLEPLLERADQALYCAKKQGRNRVIAAGHMISVPMAKAL